MRFSTFLQVDVGGWKPKERVKIEFQHYKDVFGLPDKTDILYDNLINNVFWLLEAKFARFQFRYKSYPVCYNEFNLIISRQIPQFLLIQKKQLLEKLEVFGELKNWGRNDIEEVERVLKTTDNNSNETGFVPIDVDQTDPYSKDTSSRKSLGEDKGKVNKNVVDYLEFFDRLRWEVGELELEKIFKPYYDLFFDIQMCDTELTPTVYDELKSLIDINEQNIEFNRVNIEIIYQELQQIQNDFGNYYTKPEIDNKFDEKADKTDTYTKAEVNAKDDLKADKVDTYTKTETDNKLDLKADKTELQNYYQKGVADQRFVSLTVPQTVKGEKRFESAIDLIRF